MAIIVTAQTRLVVQGITGREGSFHAGRNRDYGTDLVAGVTPGKGGQSVDGTPVYDTVAADWIDLGDLSQNSRFDAPDPTHLFDGAGRMLVRITGSGLPKGVGQVPVFACASVTGVLSR